MDTKKHLYLEIANLEVDSKIGKDRHFIAADRKNIKRIFLGLFSVIGTAIIASKAIKDIFNAIPDISPYEQVFISIISLLVGVSTAILGFLGLEKQVAQHRLVGNMYIEVARKSKRLINKMYEDVAITSIEQQYNSLLAEYLKINKEGETCPTSKSDSKKSLSLNLAAKIKIKNEITSQENERFDIAPRKKHEKMIKIISISLKKKIACLLFKCSIFSKEDLDKYLTQFE